MWEAESKVTFLLAPPSATKGQRNRCISFHRWMCEWGTVCRPGSRLWTLSQVWPTVGTELLDRNHHGWAKRSVRMWVFWCMCARLPLRGSTSITLQATGEALREISLCGSCPLLCLIKSGRDPICVSLFKGCGSEAKPFYLLSSSAGLMERFLRGYSVSIQRLMGVFKDHWCSIVLGLR